MSAYVVTGPVVVVRDDVGADVYFYTDRVLPTWVSAERAEELVELSLVGRVAEAAPVVPIRSVSPTRK